AWWRGCRVPAVGNRSADRGREVPALRNRHHPSALLYANATVLAPPTTSSTTLAAPTIVTPWASCSSVMPRGLVQAPQSQTFPLLATNWLIKSQSFGRPAASTPSVPPVVPSRTASIVHSTIASWPAAAG